MKNNRKILALVLAVLMSAVMLIAASGLEIFIIASSDEYESYATSAKYLEVLDIMKGYEDGELHLEEPILRYQAALLFARIVTGVVDDSAWGVGPSKTYTDVPEYGNVMDLITSLDIIRGYGNGIFGYNDGIRYQDMCAMFIRVLGYETEGMAYPMGYVLKVEELGFGLNNVLPGDYLNRGQVAQMLYDALVTEIAEEVDEKLDAIVKILDNNNTGTTVDETKDTYLERNFNVSERKQFVIVATENFIYSDIYADFMQVENAEEGYFTALELGSDDPSGYWNFKIDGEATNGVTEADLIGKVLNVVFDDKEPTAEALDHEDITVVHADIVKSEVYENRGELSYVKLNDDEDVLYLGTKRVELADLEMAEILTPSTEEEYIYSHLVSEDTVNNGAPITDGLVKAIKANTYFQLEVLDYDKDGVYDKLIYTPYEFGQYARRRYDNQYYTMVGQYSESPVYNISTVSEKTDANKTHFIERFLVTGELATKERAYRPEDITITVGDAGRYSLDVKLTGEAVKNGDFVLYTYNMHTGEFRVVENLGTYQTGTLTGLNTKKQTYTIDGVAMSLGLPGAMENANGLLVGDEAYAATEEAAKDIVGEGAKGEVNVRFLEYDTKLVYFEAYNGPAAASLNDYVIVDIDASIEAAEKAAEDNGEEAWDIIIGDGFATIKVLDPATGELSDANVELLVAHDNSTKKFTDVSERHFFGTWVDMEGATAFRANGVLYYAEDDDENGMLELYAYGSDEFKVVGAAINSVAAGEPSVYFSYGKSNNFIESENEAGIATERVSTGSKSVSVVIGADGYIVRKGSLGNNVTKPNALYLSEAAMALVATDKQLTIYDPVNTVKAYAEDNDNYAKNVYANNAGSIWASSSSSTYDGYGYYILLSGSEYVDSGAYLDANGDVITTESGKMLYAHVYTDLYNLMTGATEDVTVVTTDSEPVFTAVPNTVDAVLRVDAEEYDAQAVTFEEVFVVNDIYHNATSNVFRQKDWITVNIEGKDTDGDGEIDVPGRVIKHDSYNDKVFDSLDGLTYKFIDLDGGVDVDPEEYNFDDAYLFYNANKDNPKNYNIVELEDRIPGTNLSYSTIPIKRHYYQGKSLISQFENGAITTGLTASVNGKVAGQPYLSRSGWSDYLIPAVDENGETIWRYEGSLRVKVSYLYFAYYEEETNTLDAIVVRIGEVLGVVGDDVAADSFIDMSDMPVPAVDPNA